MWKNNGYNELCEKNGKNDMWKNNGNNKLCGKRMKTKNYVENEIETTNYLFEKRKNHNIN